MLIEFFLVCILLGPIMFYFWQWLMGRFFKISSEKKWPIWGATFFSTLILYFCFNYILVLLLAKLTLH